MGRHKLSSVYDSYALVVKPLKGLFTQINKLGESLRTTNAFRRESAYRCYSFSGSKAEFSTGHWKLFKKKKKAPFPVMHSKEDAQKQLQALNST